MNVILQSNFGAVSLNYTLSDQPSYGNYTIRVLALQQIEEQMFYVEEYYQSRFEVWIYRMCNNFASYFLIIK